MPKLAAT